MIDDDLDWYPDQIVDPARIPVPPGPVARTRIAWAEAVDALDAERPEIAVALRQGFVLTHDQARAAGVDRATLRRRVYGGAWTAPRRNVLCVLSRSDDDGANGSSAAIRASAAALVRPGTVISHDSAATTYGLPFWHTIGRPRVTAEIGTGEGRRDIIVHEARISADEIADWYGARITTPARTIVDSARNFGARSGLVMADAALREQLVTPGQLRSALLAATRWYGVRQARKVVALASPKPESPLESVARLFLSDHDVPLPEPQEWVATARGRFRVDGLWAARAVVLEVDGMTKYVLPRDGRTNPLTAEKVRQEALERAGYRVVRVTWADIRDEPIATAHRVRAALHEGGRRLRASRSPWSGVESREFEP